MTARLVYLAALAALIVALALAGPMLLAHGIAELGAMGAQQ